MKNSASYLGMRLACSVVLSSLLVFASASSLSFAVPAKKTWQKKTVTKVAPVVKKPVVGKSGLLATEEALLSQETPIQVGVVDLNLVRGLPLDVDGYDTGKTMPKTFSSAAQVIQSLDASPIFLVHMEALRRGYASLGKEERVKVLETLLKRHKANESSMEIGFDYGYALFLYNKNKTGLFFLRKSNDYFKTQFTALAYGMAELEADLTLENAKPDEMTTRKLDVIYQLGDAVQRDAQAHSSGFWPSFVRVIQSMKPLSAYGSFPNRDFSLSYVPIGGLTKQAHQSEKATSESVTIQTTPYSNLLNNSSHTGCTPAAYTPDNTPGANPTGGRSVTLNHNTVLMQFYPTSQPGQTRVRVMSSQGQPLLSFTTFAKPSTLVEDIDNDGTDEIVARQYAQDPLQPVLVYRYTPCGLELDHKLFDNFH